jgi:hypothetical protein
MISRVARRHAGGDVTDEGCQMLVKVGRPGCVEEGQDIGQGCASANRTPIKSRKIGLYSPAKKVAQDRGFSANLDGGDSFFR